MPPPPSIPDHQTALRGLPQLLPGGRVRNVTLWQAVCTHPICLWCSTDPDQSADVPFVRAQGRVHEVYPEGLPDVGTVEDLFRLWLGSGASPDSDPGRLG